MTPRDTLYSIIRCWESGLLWRLEWNRDEDDWRHFVAPPWEATA